MRLWFNEWFKNAGYFIKAIRENIDKFDFEIFVTGKEENTLMFQFSSHHEIEPDLEGESYLNYCLEFCKNKKIDVFVPYKELVIISKNLNKFRSLGTSVVSALDIDNVSIFESRQKLFSSLKKVDGVEVPEYYLIRNIREFGEAYDNIVNNAKLMCFEPNKFNNKKLLKVVKPELRLFDNFFNEVNNKVQLYDTYKALSSGENFEFIAMEYVNGEEYVLDCISQNGKLLVSVLRRTISNELTIVEKGDEFKSIAEKVSEELNMNYVYSIRFVKNQDKITITNVVPYMIDGLQISSVCGINFPYIVVKLAANRKINIPEPYGKIKVTKVEKYIKIK